MSLIQINIGSNKRLVAINSLYKHHKQFVGMRNEKYTNT
jgi:hypothetical protein